jgi:hypothetical protein
MSYNLVNPTTGALTRVSGNITSNIIPANASSSNKLVAKSDIIIKHNYSMVGTASLEDDIKTFVTALIALGTNTYAGYFNRSGNLGSAGNYCITVYAEEGTSTFATGYIVFGAGAMGKVQYEVSYYKPVGSSVEWNIKKLVTESDTAKRKDVTVTATASIENDIKTLLDELIAETSGSYIGSFTRTGNTSGYYSVSVSNTWNVTGIVSICGAVSAAYRVAKFKNTAQGAYTYLVEKLITENEAILRHPISIPVESGTTFNDVWSALQYQLIHTDWTFLTSSEWNSASGGYELQGYYWGDYCAAHTANNNVIITGTITWGAKPHTFSAYHDPTVPAWKININGEELMYSANNITVTKDVSAGRRIFVRNIGNTDIGALYNALQACDLLNRPSTGIFNWTIQQARTCSLGTPYDGNHWTNPVTAGELAYFQNPRISTINSGTSEWWLFWSDGNVYGSCNMWGETTPLCTYVALEYII